MRNAGKGILIIILIIMAVMTAGAEETDGLTRRWILCKPGSQVNVRRKPSKKAEAVGFLEVGDWFWTDGSSRDGWIRCCGVGEYGEGWIYGGYVAEEEPVEICQRYVCVANNRVACRRWIDGPKTSAPWLKNGSTVEVFYVADGWAMTSRGYIRSEWLEADPE